MSSIFYFGINSEIVFVEDIKLRHQNLFDQLQIADQQRWFAYFIESYVASCWVRTES